jgi:predicted ATP-dependent serine protease
MSEPTTYRCSQCGYVETSDGRLGQCRGCYVWQPLWDPVPTPDVMQHVASEIVTGFRAQRADTKEPR